MKAGQRSAGHPIDVATGVVYARHEDVSIFGMVDLVWERRYTTALLGVPPGALGPGWTTRQFATLVRDPKQFLFFAPEGYVEVFADPEGKVERGEVVRNLGTFQ